MTGNQNSSQPAAQPEADQAINVAIGILVDRAAPGSDVQTARARVLIARRPHDTVLGGYWEWPGGKIEVGEEPGDCLRREFLEELGVRVDVGRPLPIVEHRYPHGLVRLHPFFCTLSPDSDHPRNLAVAEHRWVDAPSLADYRFPQANGRLIERVIKALSD